MQGVYFYADFCTGRIWGLRQIGDTWGSALLYDAPFRITAIGEDEDGNLYVTNYNEGFILALEVRIQAPVETVVAQPPERPNIALFGSVRASSGIQSASHVIDGDPETSWTSGVYPVQWLEVTFDRFYLVDRIEMVVAQSPAGETSHQIWIGEASGTLHQASRVYRRTHLRRADSKLATRSTFGPEPSVDPHHQEPQLGRLA